MNLYNKQSLDAMAKEQGFIRDNLEKVMRLPVEFTAFPQIDKVRFPQIRSQLLPVLKRSEHFDFEAAKTEVKTYLANLLILTDEEKEYVENFNLRRYTPELLFTDAE